MKIVISSSIKNKELIQSVKNQLENLGFTVLFPNLNLEVSEELIDVSTKRRLAEEHYRAIDTADCVYFLTPNGYMGTSCKLELGYSIAKKIPIYFSEPTGDIGLDLYAKDFIQTNKLDAFLHL